MPAFDDIRRTLGTTNAAAGYTLTVFMVTFALVQPLFGAASHRFGRRPVLLFGAALFGACGFGCATAHSIGGLLAWRAAQGIGASACTVLVFAIARDRTTGERARTLIANVGATMMVAPMIAPSLGAAALALAGWRFIFVLLGIAGAVLLAIVALSFSETLAVPDPQALDPHRFLASYARIARDRTAGGYAAIAALSFGGMFAYIAGSSTLFIDELHATPRTYGLLFAVTSLSIVAGNLASNAFAKRGVGFRIALATGLGVAIVSALGVLALASTGFVAIASVLPLLCANTFALGLVAPNSAHGVLEEMPDIAGQASAVIGFARVLCGAVASALVASFAHFGPIAIAAVMTGFAIGSILTYLGVVRPADREVRGRIRAM